MDAGTVRSALRLRFAPPEWAALEEVHDRTSGCNRSADMVAVNCYASRGYEIHGIEIKVAWQDLRNEIANPSKADAVGKYCDRWWIAMPEDMKDRANDVPAAWGVILVKDAKTQRAARMPKQLDVAPPSHGFVAAMMRRAAQRIEKLSIDAATVREAEAKLKDEYTKGYKSAERDAAIQRPYAEKELATYREFERLSGISVRDWNLGNVAAAVKALLELHGADGILKTIDQRIDLLNQARVLLAREGQKDPGLGEVQQ